MEAVAFDFDFLKKLIGLLLTTLSILTPIAVTVLGILFVRSSLKRKEDAEAKKAFAEADLAKEEINKIRLESRKIIRETIHEPTINEICEGYQKLFESMEKRISALESTIEEYEKQNSELKDNVKELNDELENKEQKIETVEIENDELRQILEEIDGK